MKIFSVDQIQQCDNYTIKNEPINSIDLMERASTKLYEWIALHYKKDVNFVIFAGSGNNGGDAFALARLLKKGGFARIKVYKIDISEKLSPDCFENYQRVIKAGDIEISNIAKECSFPLLPDDCVIVDGIFGSGLTRPVVGYWASLFEYINAISSEVIAIDVPSGLFSDISSVKPQGVINASITLSFQFPKQSFLFADFEEYVGKWHLLDIGLSKTFINNEKTAWYYTQLDDIKGILKKRTIFSHKGTFGHAFLIAGSYQKMGAATLASKGCLRSGVGLLTVHVPESGYEIMQTSVPEAMLCIDETQLNYCSSKNLKNFTTIGIGPGIGKKTSMQNAFNLLLESVKMPMVIDADAINILAENSKMFDNVPENSILTPHPGEFDRLTHKHESGAERIKTQVTLSKARKLYIVLKGANTSISTPEGEVYFNSTGNSGMATAGSGDVLTGIILSLLAQGYSPLNAAVIGVFIHGLAGDIAKNQFGEEALIATDIINNLGNAFKQIKGN